MKGIVLYFQEANIPSQLRTLEEQKWQVRRFRHLKHYGLKPELVGAQLGNGIVKNGEFFIFWNGKN
jgi:hypothetical protein